MTGESFTQGPWRRAPFGENGCNIFGANNRIVARANFQGRTSAEWDANARLIAAAPDHALIAKAMCVGAGRWEPFGDGSGEFCMNGIRHSTRLDEFGVPTMTDGMRAAISRALGQGGEEK